MLVQIDGMRLEIIWRNNLEGTLMCCGQSDRRGAACLQRFLPACCAQTPAVAGPQAGETRVRQRCHEIIATGAAEFEELPGHFGADRVRAQVLGAGFAVTRAGITGAWIERTGL